MLSKIRMGVVGTGVMGSRHVTKCIESDRVESVVVFDHNKSSAMECAQKYSVRVAPTLEELLVDVDALVISTTTHSHFKIALDAMSLGVHCLVEKPLASTLSEADRMAKLADEKGIVLQVGLLERIRLNRLCPTELLRNSSRVSTRRLAKDPGREPQLGAILDLAIHDIDCMLFTMREEPIGVWSEGQLSNVQSINFAKMKFHFAGGNLWELEVSYISPEIRRQWEFSIGREPHQIDFVQNTFTGARHAHERFDPLKIQLENFIDSIVGISQPLVSGAEAARAQYWCERAEQDLRGNLGIEFRPSLDLEPRGI